MATSLRILHLEDDPVDNELIMSTLAADGVAAECLRVDSLPGYQQALQQAGFDIILSDYALPGFNGLAALALARQHAPAIPFILISGVLAEDDAIEALRSGATDFVVKTRLNRLTPAIRRALAEAHERRALQRAQSLIEVRAQQQAVVARLGLRALAGLELPELLQETISVVAETLQVEYGKVLALQPDGENLRVIAGVGWQPGVVGSAIVPVRPESQAGYTLLQESPVIVTHLPTEARFPGMPILYQHGILSGMTVVIPGQPRPFGILGIHSAQRRTFTPDDANFLQAAANVLAEAAVRQQSEQQLARHARRATLLAEASQSFAEAGPEYWPVLDNLTRRVSEFVGDACIVRLLSDDGRHLPIVSVYHPQAPVQALIQHLGRGEQSTEDAAVTHRVLVTRQPIMLPSLPPEEMRQQLDPHWWPYIDQFGLHGILTVPLRTADRVIGILGVTRDASAEPYTPEDQDFLQTLADRVAVAIENARLYRAEQQARQLAQQAAHRISRLQAVTAALSQALTPQQVTDVVVEYGLPAIGADAGSIALIDEARAALHIVQAAGYTHPLAVGRGSVPLSDRLPMTDALRSAQPIWIVSLETLGQTYPDRVPMLAEQGMASGAAVPLIIEGRPIGTLIVSYAQPRGFDEQEKGLILALAQQCAQALERARLYEAEQSARHAAQHSMQRATQAAERVRQLQAITAAFSTALNPGQVAEVVISHGLSALGASAGSVVVLEADGSVQVVAAAGYPADVLDKYRRFSLDSPVPLADAVRTGQPVWLRSRDDTARLYPHLVQYGSQTGTVASASVPLVVDNRPMGALGISFTQERAFDGETRDFCLALADQCAQAMERGRLYEAERLARQAAEQAADRTARLQAVTAALSASLTVPEAGNVIVQQIVDALGASSSSVYLLEDDEQWLVMAAQIGMPEPVRQAVRRLPVGGGSPAADVFSSREALWLRSNQAFAALYPAYAPARDLSGNQGLAVLPLLAGDRALGALSASFTQVRDFSPEDRDLLLALSRQCAQAAERAMLYSRLELRVQQRTAELQTSYAQLRGLAARLQSAREEERRRLARELHDELGGSLTGLKMDVARLRRAGDALPPDTLAQLEDLSVAIDATVKMVRRIATDLRPGILDDLGLLPAIEWQLQDFGKRSGLACTLEMPEGDLEFDPEAAIAVFRVLQESLTNVARHANATQVCVVVQRQPDSLSLSVQDDGIGFDHGAAPNKGSLGLAGMRERVFAFSGQLDIESAPGQGTRVVMKLPIRDDA